MRYIQLMQTTQFVVFQLANFFLFFFSGKYLIKLRSVLDTTVTCIGTFNTGCFTDI